MTRAAGWIVLAGLVVVPAGCRPMPPVATAVDADRAHVELAELERGRTLLIQKCGNCHVVPHPTEHAALEWPKKLGEMAVRSGLNGPQRHLIEQYLVTMSAR
jgi:nitrate/TMAO reductase-like tetraheme cytochrome c subunit